MQHLLDGAMLQPSPMNFPSLYVSDSIRLPKKEECNLSAVSKSGRCVFEAVRG
jgi:hypothetical protein